MAASHRRRRAHPRRTQVPHLPCFTDSESPKAAQRCTSTLRTFCAGEGVGCGVGESAYRVLGSLKFDELSVEMHFDHTILRLGISEGEWSKSGKGRDAMQLRV